jgi:hypothetical protein
LLSFISQYVEHEQRMLIGMRPIGEYRLGKGVGRLVERRHMPFLAVD